MSYEQAFRVHEMGYAYKKITEQLGPSPQLLAFVGYDKAFSENCGLESMDIMDQHQRVLAEIEQLDAFDLKCDDSGGILREVEHTQLSTTLDALMTTSSGTAIAVENSFKDPIAVEGIIDAIKEKAAAWAAKVVTVIKDIGDMSFREIGQKIKNLLTSLVHKVSQTTHDVGKQIKAHPYKSALIMLGSIAAAIGLLTVIGQQLKNSRAGTIENLIAQTNTWFAEHPHLGNPKASFHDHVTGRSATIYSRDPEDIKKLAQHVFGTWNELGWTKTNIIAFSDKIVPLFDKFGSALSTFTTNAVGFVRRVGSGVGMEALHVPGVSKKTSHRAITSLFWLVYRLVKTKIGGGFYHIAALLLRLMGH